MKRPKLYNLNLNVFIPTFKLYQSLVWVCTFINFTLAILCQLIHVGKIWQVCIFMITTSQNLKTDQLSALRENPMPSLLVTRFFLSTWKAPFWTKRSQKKRTLDDLLYSSNLTSCQGTGISYFFRLALLGVKEKVFDNIMRISITGI